MIRKSRMIVALGLISALAIPSFAQAQTGADNNDPKVDGKVTPKKLDKKKFKPVNLFLGVRNNPTVIGNSSFNPASEYISISKNVKVKLNKAQRCTAPLANGTPTDVARQMCPKKSFLGQGKAEVRGPGGTLINDVTVSVFNGPGKNELRLHTFSPTLVAASPIVPGKIVKSKAGKKFGQALDVPNAPETGTLMITEFNAKLQKSKKVVTARCKPKKFTYQREVTYKDGSKQTVTLKQKCKAKKGKKKGRR